MDQIINQGSAGFHLYTVVTDGYGNYIAEDTQGKELARTQSTGQDNRAAAKDLARLTTAVLRAQDPNRELGEI